VNVVLLGYGAGSDEPIGRLSARADGVPAAVRAPARLTSTNAPGVAKPAPTPSLETKTTIVPLRQDDDSGGFTDEAEKARERARKEAEEAAEKAKKEAEEAAERTKRELEREHEDDDELRGADDDD
jgi:hypothetical protein